MKRGIQKGLFDVCPTCGLTYSAFKTGLSYHEVYLLRWRDDPDPTTWLYKRRHTVLGMWRAMKQELWMGHLDGCKKGAADTLEIVLDYDAFVEY